MSSDGSITEYRWNGWTDDDLADAIDRLNAGSGAEAMTPALDALTAVAKSLYHIDTTLRDQLAAIGVNWQTPQSSELAKEVLGKAQQYADNASQQGMTSAAGVEAQTAAFLAARNAMPDSATLRSTTKPCYLFGMQGKGTYASPSLTAHGETDASQAAARRREAHDRAVDAWTNYNRHSNGNLAAHQPLSPATPIGAQGGCADPSPCSDTALPDALTTSVAAAPPLIATPGGDVFPVSEDSGRAGEGCTPSVPPAPAIPPRGGSGGGSSGRSPAGGGSGPVVGGVGSYLGGAPGEAARREDTAPNTPGAGAWTGAQPSQPPGNAPGCGALGGGVPGNSGGPTTDGKVSGAAPVPIEGRPPGDTAGAGAITRGPASSSTVSEVAIGSAIAAGVGAAGVAGVNAVHDRMEHGRRPSGDVAEGAGSGQTRSTVPESEGEPTRARPASTVIAEPEGSQPMLEPATTGQGDRDGERIRRYGVDAEDLFTDGRMISDPVLGDGSPAGD